MEFNIFRAYYKHVINVDRSGHDSLEDAMSVIPLAAEDARQLISEIFIYHMPFNRELGLALTQHNDDFVQLDFSLNKKLIGNAMQHILHGGVIAAVLDVAAGLVCVTSALLRQETLMEQDLRQRLSKMGTIDLRVDYLRPGRGNSFTATSRLLRGGNKIAVARVELHNEEGNHIASAVATYLVG